MPENERPEEARQTPPVDYFFIIFVRAAERVGEGPSVVLSLQGKLVTGRLISGRNYFEGLGRLYEDRFQESSFDGGR